MAKIILSAADLGEQADFIMESAATSPDPLEILIAREEADPEEEFFAALAELLQARRPRKRATFH